MTPGHSDTIGPYEVARELGRGGMGVVYLARDTRLDRQVAIKALPEHLASDPDRLGRFEREAKTLAQLNHPNVAGIHGVEEHEGARYLVLEYVEGQTLAARLDRGALPVDEALEIAVQIAAGVEAAHEAGVIHRDLKPGNIIITPESKVKVLDFGLAKVAEGASSSSSYQKEVREGSPAPGIPDDAAAATVTSPVHQRHSPTMPGVILGTAAYMSPEQARGRSVDKRTDNWSFGVVLYEMLVGANPFVGETVGDSIGAILHKNVEWERVPQALPIGVRRLIERCLARDRNRRLQAIGDARVELEDAVRRVEVGQLEGLPSGPPAGWARWAWPAVSGALLVALVGVLTTTQTSPTAREQGTPNAAPICVSQVRQLTDLDGQEQDPALSPNGRTLAFTAREGVDLDIFSLRVGGENPINLTSEWASDDHDPAFSPDGERIAFVSTREGGGVFVMGATGENPRRVSDEGYDPAWSPDGQKIIYTTEIVRDAYSRYTVASLRIVDVKTRERRPLDTGESAGVRSWETDAVGPAWSPDGNWIAFWAAIDGQRDIFVAPASGGQRIALTDDTPTDWNPMWSADGRRVYFLSDRGGRANLCSIEVDPETGRPASEAAPVTPGPALMSEAAMAADGSRIAVTVQANRSEVLRVGVDPKTERLVGEPTIVHATSNQLFQPQASRDGQWIAYRSGPPSEDIYVMRGDGTGRRRLMNDTHKDRGPRWSADGHTITFYSNRDGQYKVWQMRRDGTDMRPVAQVKSGSLHIPSWSPDGQVLAANTPTPGGVRALFFDRAGDGTLRPRDMKVPDFSVGSWSPAGDLIAGRMLHADGAMVRAVLNVDTGEARPVTAPDGGLIGTAYFSAAGWLDADRFVEWDPDRRRAYVANMRSGETRWLEDPIDGPAVLHLVQGGTEMIIFRVHENTDVWAFELGVE